VEDLRLIFDGRKVGRDSDSLGEEKINGGWGDGAMKMLLQLVESESKGAPPTCDYLERYLDDDTPHHTNGTPLLEVHLGSSKSGLRRGDVLNPNPNPNPNPNWSQEGRCSEAA